MPNSEGNSQSATEPENHQAPPSFAIFRAPNGLEIFHHAMAETKYVYQEIFEDRIYFRHGIHLQEDETVFDIGSNIGLFTIFVKENHPNAKVHAFEPSPVIHRVLQANVAKYGSSVLLHNCGIAGNPGEAKFTFYPRYSIMSGFHADSSPDRETLKSGIRSSLKEQGIDQVQNRFLESMVQKALSEKQEHVCALRTISEIIDDAGIAAIGLLKIDAEGSELDILSGIREEHWSRIRQIVLEIHDSTGMIRGEVTNVLEARGYHCVCEQEKRLSDSGIFNCYARRS